MKSLGILVIYDTDGRVDDYHIYLLMALKKIVSRLVVVCNGEMQKDGVVSLKEIVDDVFIRENKGYDAGAFKEALTLFLGWDKVWEYDELVLLNDTCYGPLYPLEVMFGEMAARDCDYWAVTRGGAMNQTTSVWPEHVQPYFWVVRSRLLRSSEFTRFWDELCVPFTYLEAITFYELRIREFFSGKGFKEETYVDGDYFITNADKNFPYIFHDSYRLIKNHRCPFVKRKAFTFSNLEMSNYNSGETARKTLDYIAKQTEYPVDLIWKNLIRLNDVNALQSSLHLNYVLPVDGCMASVEVPTKNIAVFAHLYYPDLIEHCFEYINGIPDYIDIIITTSNQQCTAIINECIEKSGRDNYQIIETENRGREISALLIACKHLLMKYEYLCFVHDKKSNSALPYPSVGQSFMDVMWENSIKSSNYIANVISCFESNPFLGFLSPPKPYASYLATLCNQAWILNYEKTSDLAKRLKLKCKISPDIPPFDLGTTFWCRASALRPLFEHEFKYEDFHPEPMPTDATISHAIERIFPYVAQSEGFYSGVMMTDEYASLYTTNLQYVVEKFVLANPNITQFSDINYHNSSSYNKIMEFLANTEKIYIYGAGNYGDACTKRFRSAIKDFKGYIVSDGRKQENRMLDNVYEVSEITPRDDEGIIVALSRVNEQEVMLELRKRGFTNCISFSNA